MIREFPETISQRRIVMKKLALLFFAVGLVMSFALKSMALDTATINVQATVLGVCTISASPGLMDFGSIDPATFVDTQIAGAIDFSCTNGESYSIDFGGVVNPGNPVAIGRVLNSGTDTMNYNVNTLSSSTGVATGVLQNYNFNVELLAADVAPATAGIYTDSFTFDITP